MGWLGWTEQQTLDADVNAIQIAYKGKVDMLKACFGGGGDGSKPTSPPKGGGGKQAKMTPKLFDAMFGGGKR